MGRDFLSIHRGSGKNEQGEFKYWVCKHNSDWLGKVSKKRKIIVFNWGDMMDGAVRMSMDMSKEMLSIKAAMNRRQITYNCIDAQYMMEDAYVFF